MKNIIFIIFVSIGAAMLLGCCPNTCAAQGTENLVMVDINKLPANIQAQIEEQAKADLITQKIETYGEWAGMGKEIGVATREGLTAVKDVTLDLAESELGRTVIYLIVWKVMGIDIIRILIGFIIIMIATIVVVKSYMRSFGTRRLTSKSGPMLWRKKEYEEFSPEDFWGDAVNRSAAQMMHPVIWLIIVGISYAIMFA